MHFSPTRDPLLFQKIHFYVVALLKDNTIFNISFQIGPILLCVSFTYQRPICIYSFPHNSSLFGIKQNRSTEGCSKLKRSVDMTSSGKNGLNIRTNSVIRSKSVLKSSSVINSQIGVMSDQLRVSLYMVMSQNVM